MLLQTEGAKNSCHSVTKESGSCCCSFLSSLFLALLSLISFIHVELSSNDGVMESRPLRDKPRVENSEIFRQRETETFL